MKQEIGGYLNLNESFKEVFGNMSNLNEGKKKKTIKDFFTKEIEEKINFNKFKKYCEEAENKAEDEDLTDNFDWKWDSFIDDIAEKHDKKDGDATVQGILAYISSLNENFMINLNEAVKKKTKKKVVAKVVEEVAKEIQKGSDFIKNYNKNEAEKLISKNIKDDLQKILDTPAVYDTDFNEENIVEFCIDIIEQLKKNKLFTEFEITTVQELRTLYNVINTTTNKVYKETYNETRPSKKRYNDIIIDKYITPFIVVCLELNKNEFFKEFVKYYRETALNDKMLKSIK